MSRQASQPGPDPGEVGDWWSQLYDSASPDTGGTPEEDSLDDRFASAARAVVEGQPDGGPEAHRFVPSSRRPDPAPAAGADPAAVPPARHASLGDLAPATVLESGECGPVAFRAVSARGDRAGADGGRRGEALLVARFGDGPDGVLVLATATAPDGTDETRRAAREACSLVVEAVGRTRERLAADLGAVRRSALRETLHRIVDHTRAQLRARAAALGRAPHDHATSLRALLLPTDPANRVRVHFGDGDNPRSRDTGAGGDPGKGGGPGLFRLRGGVWREIAPVPEEPSASARELTPGGFLFRATESRPGDVTLMATPGLARALRGTGGAAALLAERWSEVPDQAVYLADIRTGPDPDGDDRTAVTLWER